MAPPRFTEKFSKRCPTGRPGGYITLVLCLKVANTNFRKSQAESACCYLKILNADNSYLGMVPRTLENLENLEITWNLKYDLENLENLEITWNFVL